MEIIIFILVTILIILLLLEKILDFECDFLILILCASLIGLSFGNIINNRNNIINNNTNDLIVTSIKLENSNQISKYTCKFYKKGNTHSEFTVKYRFYDEIGKFNIGDTLKIVKK